MKFRTGEVLVEIRKTGTAEARYVQQGDGNGAAEQVRKRQELIIRAGVYGATPDEVDKAVRRANEITG